MGKLFGDRGYISQALFESLFVRGLELITKRRKNMKNALMPLLDKVLLRKRPIIETVIEQVAHLLNRRNALQTKQGLSIIPTATAIELTLMFQK